MFSALPSSSASQAAELVPPTPASPAGVPPDVTPSGEGVAKAPDFAGVFALADAPAAGVPARVGGLPASVKSDATALVPDEPRPQVTAFRGDGPVPRAVRLLKSTVVAPDTIPAGVGVLAESAPPVASATAGPCAAVEPPSPERLGRAASKEKKSEEVAPSSPPAPGVVPQVLVPSQVPDAVPMTFFSTATGATSEATVDFEGAGERGAESTASAEQPAPIESPVYSKYTDKSGRISSPAYRGRATAPADFSPARQAVAPIPQRFIPAPASAPVVSADTAAISSEAAGYPSAGVSVPAAVSVPASSGAPAPAAIPSPGVSVEAPARAFEVSGYVPAVVAFPAPIAVPMASVVFTPAPVATSLPGISAETSAIPFAVSGSASALVSSPAPLFVPPASVAPAPAPTPSPGFSAQAPARSSAVSGYAPAVVSAPAPILAPTASIAPAPGVSIITAAISSEAAGAPSAFVAVPAPIAVPMASVVITPAPAATSSPGAFPETPAMPSAVSSYAPEVVSVPASIFGPTTSVALPSAEATAEAVYQNRASAATAPVAAVFADPTQSGPLAKAMRNGENRKNIIYSNNKEALTNYKNEDGTKKADVRLVMQSPAAQAFSSAAVPSAVERVEVLPASSFQETPATAASRLVERVVAAAERLEARPAEPVWVRLDLAGEHRVDVKVALRDGRVFADFRTDSDELRAALSQAWDGFVRGREAAGSRWAEPVFAAANPVAPALPVMPVSASSAADGHARPDADSGRQSDRREPPASWNEASAPRSSAPRAASAVAPVPPVSRPDSSRHLSALA